MCTEQTGQAQTSVFCRDCVKTNPNLPVRQNRNGQEDGLGVIGNVIGTVGRKCDREDLHEMQCIMFSHTVLHLLQLMSQTHTDM